jgi:hypothetical protein
MMAITTTVAAKNSASTAATAAAATVARPAPSQATLFKAPDPSGIRPLVNVSIIDLSGPGAGPEAPYVARSRRAVNQRTTV